MAVRWYLRHPLSGASVMELLAERDIDVSTRTVLRWVQTFGPLLAAEARKHRRRPGAKWYVDEVFFVRKSEKRYLYGAVDEHGQVLDVLFRNHRDGESAQAFFKRTLSTTGQQPDEVITDHHQPYVKAVATTCPAAKHTRTGLHRARGETTKPIERSHVPTRDRLRSSRGLKTLATGHCFFEGFEVLQALHRGHVHLRDLVPDYDDCADATPHAHARAVVVAVNALGARLRREQ
jgi:putative transposase